MSEYYIPFNGDDYLSFELSQLLSELGFIEECHTAFYKHCYVEEPVIATYQQCNEFFFDYEDCEIFDVPTLYQAQKFIRENYKIDIFVINSYNLSLFDIDQDYYCYLISKNGSRPKMQNNLSHYKTYEDALAAGLNYVIKKLISINRKK